VSAAERMTISAGLWPRSTAMLPSAMVPGWAARRCIPARLCLKRGGDRRPVEPLEADDDEAADPRFAGGPGPIEIVLNAGADPLDDLAQLLAGNGEKALEAEDIVRRQRRRDTGEEQGRVGDRP